MNVCIEEKASLKRYYAPYSHYKTNQEILETIANLEAIVNLETIVNLDAIVRLENPFGDHCQFESHCQFEDHCARARARAAGGRASEKLKPRVGGNIAIQKTF